MVQMLGFRSLVCHLCVLIVYPSLLICSALVSLLGSFMVSVCLLSFIICDSSLCQMISNKSCFTTSHVVFI